MLWVIGSNLAKEQDRLWAGENIVWSRLVHLKIYKSRYPMMGICFFLLTLQVESLNGGYFKVKED